MRVLVSFVSGRGHLLPLVPLAWALRGAGHDLAVAGQPHSVTDHGVFGAVFPDVPTSRRPPPDGGTGTLAELNRARSATLAGH